MRVLRRQTSGFVLFAMFANVRLVSDAGSSIVRHEWKLPRPS